MCFCVFAPKMIVFIRKLGLCCVLVFVCLFVLSESLDCVCVFVRSCVCSSDDIFLLQKAWTVFVCFCVCMFVFVCLCVSSNDDKFFLQKAWTLFVCFCVCALMCLCVCFKDDSFSQKACMLLCRYFFFFRKLGLCSVCVFCVCVFAQNMIFFLLACLDCVCVFVRDQSMANYSLTLSLSGMR